MNLRPSIALFVGFLLLLAGFGLQAAQQGTAFTYQGELKQAGQPANGPFDFEVGLYLQGSGGSSVAVLQIDDVTVTDGIFTLALDFTAVPFDGTQTWLGIGVRPSASVDPFTALLPRQTLTSVPYALNARSVEVNAINNVAIADSSVGSSKILDHSITALDLAANSVGAPELADNAVDSAAIINGTVAAVDIADGSIGTTKIVDTSVNAAKIVDSEVQRRVSGSCASGEYLVGINQDGSVLCQVLPIGLEYTLDSAGSVGWYTSIAVRSSEFPIISYYDLTNNDLKVFDCSNASCSAGTARTLDSTGNVGGDTSIAVRSTGFPIISYLDINNDDLKVYDCSNASCSAGTARTLDSTGTVGQYTSIAVRSTGFPIISYYDITNGDLKVFSCGDERCAK